MRTVRERVLSKLLIQPETGCLLWTGALTWNGYGNFMLPDRSNVRVHRLMYEWFAGPIPDGMQIDHLCRVRRCASPAHLEPVTCQENLLRGAGLGGRLRAVATPS